MCELKLVVDIHGTEKEVNVLIDSGFTSMTGFGLKLPVEFAEYADHTGTGHVRVADNRVVAAASIPDAKIIQVEEHQLRDGVTIPTLFFMGRSAIGVWFLQRCVLRLDGPEEEATLEFKEPNSVDAKLSCETPS
jgi:hypothetical protein